MGYPQWTEPITPVITPGEDHLGLLSTGDAEQRSLTPGVISVTDRARYYSIYAWILHKYIHDPESNRRLKDLKGTYFKRHEAALIAACYGHHNENAEVGLLGSKSARKIWESGNQINLNYRYLKNPLGGLGQTYRAQMQVMGIITDPPEPKAVYGLTTQGETLARAYGEAIRETRYFRKLSEDGIMGLTLTHVDAREYGEVGCLCTESIVGAPDHLPLMEAFFRWDVTDPASPHAARRRTFGMALDIVHQADGDLTLDGLRPAFYLGEYASDQPYNPSPAFVEWTHRWRTITARQQYVFSLQCLWGAFILILREQSLGMPYERFQDWMIAALDDGLWHTPLVDYMDGLSSAVGAAPWYEDAEAYDQACKLTYAENEVTLSNAVTRKARNAEALLNCAVQTLVQFFLRFLSNHQSGTDSWQSLSRQERLPMARFFEDTLRYLNQPIDGTVGGWLNVVLRDYIIGQHEMIALQKLRYSRWDTFKFYYQDGCFYWPYPNPDAFQQPIGYSGLRLVEVLSIMSDLGLVVADEDNLSLTNLGVDTWHRVQEVA